MAEMNVEKQQLLDSIEKDRDQLVQFFSDFVASPSPNPPGDTTVAVKHITDFLDLEELPYRLIDPQLLWPTWWGHSRVPTLGDT